MTVRECAIVMAYTGVVMLADNKMKYFYDYIEEIMGKRLYTHEISMYQEEITQKSKYDFLQLCSNSEEPLKYRKKWWQKCYATVIKR